MWCVSSIRLPAADAERRRAPLADAVERQDRRLVERAREERAGGVALVVVGEDQSAPGVAARAPSRMVRRMCSFSFSQTRHGHAEAAEAARARNAR